MAMGPARTPPTLPLPVPLKNCADAKARRLPRTVPRVRIPLGFSAISRTCWRRGWDSNPRYAHAYNGFRDRPVRPLRHPSARSSACQGPQGACGPDRPARNYPKAPRPASNTLEQIGIDGIAVGDPINRVNLLYFIDVDRIHRIDRTRDVGSIDPDPV